MMTCDWCGKIFPADANACVEAGIAVFDPSEEGEEWKGETPPPQDYTKAEVSDSESVKKAFGITDEQFEELLDKGSLDGLGAVICLECQDKGLTDEDMEESQ